MNWTRLISIVIFALQVLTSSFGSAELSAREKIKIHLEWLKKRAEIKNKFSMMNNGTVDITDFNKLYETQILDKSKLPIFKFNTKEDPMKNEVIYPSEFENSINKSIRNITELPSSTTSQSTQIHDIGISVTTEKSPTTQNHQTTTTTTTATANIEETLKTEEYFTTTTTTSPITNINLTTTTATIPIIKKPSIGKFRKFPRWGRWAKWSECSRSCGGGVKSQERKCITKRPHSRKRFLSTDCVGLFKRYQLCNEQACPSNEIDFRQQQCSSYDDADFQSVKYEWEPYIKDDAECVLNCKPIGMIYFATLNETVIDGTVCNRPAEYYRTNYTGRSICVEGICKGVHGSGVIAGSYANSGTINCAGLICRPISGIFTTTPLPDGYIHVATLPAGASNISITELKNSKNLLVLKLPNSRDYAFNGNLMPSASGTYELAGSVFDYRRIDGLVDENGNDIDGVTEWMTCLGPITEAVQLMVLARESNPGIKYDFMLPISSVSDDDDDDDSNGNSIETERDYEMNVKSGTDETLENISNRPIQKRKRKYHWKAVGYTACSKSCGGGTQKSIIRCMRDAPKRFYAARRCSHSEKPFINENLLRCNTQPCPAYWRLEDWEDCRCHHGVGYRQRESRCVQELAAGVVIQVNSAACLEDEPVNRKLCDCPKTNSRRRIPNRNRFQAHTRTPIETIIINSTTPKHFDIEKVGTWLVSDWNQHCSAECGTGVEHRSIFCDRSQATNSERCDLRYTPDTTRPCENERTCDNGEWFTSPWEQCSGSCFNLTRTRQVICIRNQLIADDDECALDERPAALQNCTLSDVEYCKARWHYSTWTECSKPCDGGTQRRSVKCLELDLWENTLRESTVCRYSEREPVYRSCNTESCRVPRVEMTQNDGAISDCIDEFNNCHLVVKARLCSYDYYQQNCCYSCRVEIST